MRTQVAFQRFVLARDHAMIRIAEPSREDQPSEQVRSRLHKRVSRDLRKLSRLLVVGDRGLADLHRERDRRSFSHNLSRYTHRVAISNSRLLAMDERGVTFRWKDYRPKGETRYKAMTLSPEEFMRRFLLHVLPSGFHRTRHYGLLANGARRLNLAAARQLLGMQVAASAAVADDAAANDEPDSKPPTFVCRHCGRPMVIVLLLAPEPSIRAPPRASAR